jgi:hypothetical protein
MTREKVAQILNGLFPEIKARSGYIGNCSPCGKYDGRAYRIFTKIDIGMSIFGEPQFLSINLPDGEVTALTVARCVSDVLRWDNRQSVSPAVAQILSAVRYAA